jgi:ABC-type transport system involved in cytochrome bd biosynthesis fused ATPase/permease subunit
VFKNYDVKVRVDEFFGGHVAVLGNTGSGKSLIGVRLLDHVIVGGHETLSMAERGLI